MKLLTNPVGIGDYASWFLGAVIFRDVQTGQKYQFANDRWLAVEYSDGEVDRTIPVVEGELPLRRRFYQTRENNLKQNHVWFSIFNRPPRSRYTRCQRVTAGAVCLYLNMLGNAMWFGMVTQPSLPDFDIFGIVQLSWEQIFFSLIINAMTFPFVFLIVILFKYSKPSKLRTNQLLKAMEDERQLRETEGEDEENEDNEDSENEEKDDDKETDIESNNEEDEEDIKSLVSNGRNIFFLIV